MDQVTSKNILFTRDQEHNLKDQQLLKQTVHQCFQVPLIETAPYQNRVFQKIDYLNYDWIFFTSSNAVSYFMENLSSLTALKKIKIAVIGQKTKERLMDFGIYTDFIPTLPTSVSFINEWLTYVKKINQKIFLPKSNLAKSTIKLVLEQHNHQVVEQVIYRNKLPQASKVKLQRLLTECQMDIVLFASPSAWLRFYEVYQLCSKSNKIVFGAIGPVTYQAILSSGETAILPDNHHFSMQGLLSTLNLI